MSEIPDIAAALIWFALGMLAYLAARSLSRKLDALHDEIPVGPGPGPVGKEGPWGICPKCGAVGYCYWDGEKDTRTCMACGHTDNGTARSKHGRRFRPCFERTEKHRGGLHHAMGARLFIRR